MPLPLAAAPVAVLLDVDDTLVDTRGAYRAALAAVADRWLPHLDAAGREAALLQWATDPSRHFRRYTRGECTLLEQRRARADELHARFGGPPLDDLGFATWDAAYEAAFEGAWRATDDAAPLLDELARRGVRTGVVTNVAVALQLRKLAVVGLRDRFEVIVGVDTLGVGKPDPRVFRLACERLGVPPGAAAYVGDELDVDARGAAAAGLRGVWLDRHGDGGRPDDVPVVTTLGEVPAVLGL